VVALPERKKFCHQKSKRMRNLYSFFAGLIMGLIIILPMPKLRRFPMSQFLLLAIDAPNCVVVSLPIPSAPWAMNLV